MAVKHVLKKIASFVPRSLATRKYRRGMVRYANEKGLRNYEKGFAAETNKPLGRPARAFLLRIQKHMHAEHPHNFPIKYVDGTLNSKTKKILVPPPPPVTMNQKIIKSAIKEIGVHESPWGSNDGTRVNWYQSSTGAYNAAWCASFCSKMAQINGYNGAVSAGAWYLTDNCGISVTLAHAIPGDCVSLDTGEGHVGILLRVNHTLGTVTLIAGNTGDMVKQKDYPIRMIHSICRLNNRNKH